MLLLQTAFALLQDVIMGRFPLLATMFSPGLVAGYQDCRSTLSMGETLKNSEKLGVRVLRGLL